MKPVQRILFYYSAAAALSLSFVSCSDDELLVDEFPVFSGNDPVFYSSVQIDGEPVTIRAGEDAFYMHTDFSQNSSGVYTTRGILADYECAYDYEDCPGSLEFIFKDNQTSGSEGSNLNNSLKVGAKPFKGLVDSTFTHFLLNFQSQIEPSGSAHNLMWEFAPGVQAVTTNPGHSYKPDENEATIKLFTEDATKNITTTTLNKVDLNQDCNVDFTYQVVSGEISALNTTKTGEEPVTLLWDFGSGYMPIDDQPTLNFSGQDTVRACLKLIAANGCEAVRCKTLIINPNYDLATGNFSFNKERIYDVNDKHLNEVIIKYINSEGKIYDSSLYPQPEDSYLEITGINNYRDDHESNTTKKLDIEYSVRVYGESEEDFMDLKEGEASIAVPIP